MKLANWTIGEHLSKQRCVELLSVTADNMSQDELRILGTASQILACYDINPDFLSDSELAGLVQMVGQHHSDLWNYVSQFMRPLD